MKSRQLLNPAGLAMIAAIATAVPTALNAAPEEPAPDASYRDFQKLDANHDGYIGRDEAARLRDFGRAFSEADVNRDGKLDRDEFAKAQAIYDRVRAKAYLDDSVITAKVKAALIKDPEVKSLEVSVETNQGVVLLSGFVDNDKQMRRAQEIAASIQGVRNVKSNLLVKS